MARKKDKPSVAIEMINPQIASQWIERIHPLNRKTRSKHINTLAADMRRGKCYLSNDAITWDEEGWIINGAHRLHAIVVSGVECEVIVLRDAVLDARLVMDTGMKRSTDDNFLMAGYSFPRNCGATVRKLLYGYTQFAKLAIPDQEVLEFMENNGDAICFAHEHLPQGRTSHSLIRAVVARAYLKRAPKEKLKRFCEVLRSGLSVDRLESSIVRLRNFMVDDTNVRKSSKTPGQVYGKAERALQAYLEGEELSRLESAGRELFPIRSIDAGVLEDMQEQELQTAEAVA